MMIVAGDPAVDHAEVLLQPRLEPPGLLGITGVEHQMIGSPVVARDELVRMADDPFIIVDDVADEQLRELGWCERLADDTAGKCHSRPVQPVVIRAQGSR